MTRFFALLRHHLAGSGMLLALLLLCAFFSVVTWMEQHPLEFAPVYGIREGDPEMRIYKLNR